MVLQEAHARSKLRHCERATKFEAGLILRLRPVLELKRGDEMARFSHLIAIIYFENSKEQLGKDHALIGTTHVALFIPQQEV